MANQPDTEDGVCLHVVRHNEKWAIKTGNQSIPSFLFDSRDEAIVKARELSLIDAAEVVVHTMEKNVKEEDITSDGSEPITRDDFKIFRHPKGWAVSNGSIEHPLFIYADASDAIVKAKELSMLHIKPFSFIR